MSEQEVPAVEIFAVFAFSRLSVPITPGASG